MTQQKIQSSQLSSSGVTPGAYTSANVTVDIAGRITAISNGSGGGGGSAPLSEIVFGTGSGLTSNSSFKFNNTTSSFYVNGPSAVTNNNSSEVLIQNAKTSGGGGQSIILLTAPDDLNSSSVNITAGRNFNDNSAAGDIVLQAGQGSVTAGSQSSGGNLSFLAGAGDFGGSIQLVAGNGNENIAGNVTIMAGSSDVAAGDVSISAGVCFTDVSLDGSVIIRTNNIARISIRPHGEFDIGGVGSAGNVLTSNGAGSPPSWQPASGSISAPNKQLVFGTGSGVTSDANLTYDTSTDTLTVAGTGAGIILSGTGEALSLRSDTSADITINGTERFGVNTNGSYRINGNTGTAGQMLISAGNSAPPVWQDQVFRNYSDPAYQWYGPSGVSLASGSGAGGDPFIIWDSTNSQWIMYYWLAVVGAPFVRCYYRTSSSLEGPWSAQTEIPTLANYHKPVLLVDEEGVPVQVGGLYHAYLSYYNGALTDKEIFHFTAANLTGPYTLGSKVIAKGASGSKDEYNTDTPYAIYKNSTVYLWYMGAPASSLPTYGFAERMLLAQASVPNGPFTKDYTDVLSPSTTVSDWDYGWLGGTQIRVRPNGTYIMVYNAGDTRPGSAGLEPATSRIGYAYSNSITGPWTKDLASPYFSPTGMPTTGLEQTDIWRGHIAYEKKFNQWYTFYNTGTAPEIVTFARQGEYSFLYGTGAGLDVIVPTTGVQAVTNSRVNLAPGNYEVSYQVNYIASSIGGTPALDIDTVLRLNGTNITNNQSQTISSRLFVGSYPFENDDTELKWNVPVTSAGSYVDITTQVTGGTPTVNTSLRRLRINIRRVK